MIEQNIQAAYSFNQQPYPEYQLKNNYANTQRIKQRIASLVALSKSSEQVEINGDGFKIDEHKEDNRIWLTFDSKPSSDICSLVKRHGFKWSYTRTAWVRQINHTARVLAKTLATELTGKIS